MFTIVDFLLATVFSNYKYLCMTLYPFSYIREIPCFISPPDFSGGATYKLHLDDTLNTSCLVVISTYIYLITKMNSLIINQGDLAA